MGSDQYNLVKIWWMIPRVWRSASDIPTKTQFLLVEAREKSAIHDDFSSDSEFSTEENTSYILFLPGLDGAFRVTLQELHQMSSNSALKVDIGETQRDFLSS